MKHLKSNRGYALLIALAIIILFTVLGMTMLALVTNGTKKNVLRQEMVQATAQSEKGIERIVNQINSELTAALGETGLKRTDFITALNTTLNMYECDDGTKIEDKDGINGSYSVCIEGDPKSVVMKNKEVNELRKLVNFKSIGFSGGNSKELISTIEIGAETFPETLKYAVGTFIDPKSVTPNRKNGEGNLYLHGGVEIEGDIKVAGDLFTGRNANLNPTSWIKSILPSIKQTSGEKFPKLVLGGNLNLLNSNLSNRNHINDPNRNKNNYSTVFDEKELFNKDFAPRIVNRDAVRKPTDILSKKEIYRYDRRNNPSILVLNRDRSEAIQSKDMPNSIVFPTYHYRSKNNDYYEDTATFEIKGKNSFKKMSTLGKLEIKSDADVTFKEGLYVENGLTIGNGIESNNLSKYANITLEGPAYINGDVLIKGANLKSNVLMYVEGNVNIEYSSLAGKGNKGSLIIFATGDISFKNNSSQEPFPSEIKGFFYSEGDMTIFGVLSNLKIHGGVSARRIVLNAVKGKGHIRNGWYGSTYEHYSVSEQLVAGVDSRLQIIYDPEIISTFSDLHQKEPIILSVDPPIERQREVK